jgi:hypothetical protein
MRGVTLSSFAKHRHDAKILSSILKDKPSTPQCEEENVDRA